MSVVASITPIITEEAFREILHKAKAEIEAHPGRSILNVILAPDNAHFHLSLDPRPDQPALIDASIARASAKAGEEVSPSELQFAAEIKRLWSSYDHEEMVLCILTVGQATQITVRPKPWLDEKKLHEHCSCGIRRGADPKHDADHLEANVIGDAAAALATLFEVHQVPESHGIDHARRVLSHTRGALDCEKSPPSAKVRLAMILAALLHDADDRKYFGKGARKARPEDLAASTAALSLDDPQEAKDSEAPHPNAERILTAALTDYPDADEIKALALEAIGYVSASGNGNEIPPRAEANPFLLLPRWCDRLEAIGEPGVVRCWEYTLEVGRPLYNEDSPSPATSAEVFTLATAERFAEYQERKESATMIDHYFDKIIHLLDPLVSHSNEYLATVARMRIQPLIEVCTAARPDALKARLEMAKARTNTGAA
jgi:uncharacterized protein